MENARYTMAELFSKLNTNTFLDTIKLGTLGHVGDSIVTPKGSDNGFVKERDRMFSQYETHSLNTVITTLRKGDAIFLTDDNKYYIYNGISTTNYSLTSVTLASDWTLYGSTAPYTYTVSFLMPGTADPINGTQCINVVEDDSGAQSSVNIKQNGTSVTFTFDFATAAANSQNGTNSIFTEASLWANDRIFAMKTFKAKIKDSTVLLRIVWTITF